MRLAAGFSLVPGARKIKDASCANIDGAFDHPINARFHYYPWATNGVADILFVIIDCCLNNHRRINIGRDILEQDAE